MPKDKRSSFVRRQLRQLFRQFLSDNKVPVAMLCALYLASIAVGWLLGGRGYWQGFSNGFLLAALIAVYLLLFLLHTGGINQLAGAYGETRTQEELDKARKRGSIWDAVHNLELADGDIDSVVFAPGGVLALETKWMMRNIDQRWLTRDIAQTRRSADKARAVLRSKNVAAGVFDVIPVLVIWGKGTVDLADHEIEDGVHLINGTHLQRWLERFAHGAITQVEAEAACRSLAQFARDQAASATIHTNPAATQSVRRRPPA